MRFSAFFAQFFAWCIFLHHIPHKPFFFESSCEIPGKAPRVILVMVLFIPLQWRHKRRWTQYFIREFETLADTFVLPAWTLKKRELIFHISTIQFYKGKTPIRLLFSKLDRGYLFVAVHRTAPHQYHSLPSFEPLIVRIFRNKDAACSTWVTCGLPTMAWIPSFSAHCRFHTRLIVSSRFYRHLCSSSYCRVGWFQIEGIQFSSMI